MSKFAELGITKQSDELKKLILENPDLPIVVLVSDDATSGNYCWTYCSSIHSRIEEILDCDYYRHDDTVFTDRDDLKEQIEDNLYDEYCDKTEEEYTEAINKKMEELEPYWKKVIAIFAGN